MAILRWLHLSDWHQGGGDFDRKVVADALLDDIKARESIDPGLAKIDFFFFTGDLTYSGQKKEYEDARDLLLNPTLEALALHKDRFFLIPGNHDLDRKMFRRLPAELNRPFENREKANEWLEDADLRGDLLKPFNAYQQFVNDFEVPGFGSYGDTRLISFEDKTVGILGVNSALMCGRPNSEGKFNDYGFLTVGEPQLHYAVRELSKADIRIGLIHHPFDWLNEDDREIVKARLYQGCDFILRGHVHQQSVEITKSTSGDCVTIPGGSCFDGRVPYRPRYINAYNYVVYDTETCQGTVYLRRWNLNDDGWTADTDRGKDGRYTFSTGIPIPASVPSTANPL